MALLTGYLHACNNNHFSGTLMQKGALPHCQSDYEKCTTRAAGCALSIISNSNSNNMNSNNNNMNSNNHMNSNNNNLYKLSQKHGKRGRIADCRNLKTKEKSFLNVDDPRRQLEFRRKLFKFKWFQVNNAQKKTTAMNGCIHFSLANKKYSSKQIIQRK